MSAPRCPACDWGDVTTRYEPTTIQGVTLPLRVDTCSRCGEEGDFTLQNEALIQAVEQAQQLAALRAKNERLRAEADQFRQAGALLLSLSDPETRRMFAEERGKDEAVVAYEERLRARARLWKALARKLFRERRVDRARLDALAEEHRAAVKAYVTALARAALARLDSPETVERALTDRK